MKDSKMQIKGWVIKLSPERYWDICDEIERHPEKAGFYLGLLLGTAKPQTTHIKRSSL